MLTEDISNLIDISSITKSGLDLSQNHVNTLSQAVNGLNQKLHELAISPNGYEQLEFVFDISEVNQASALTEDWSNGIFNDMPTVLVLSDLDMQGAAGAYSAQNQTIYLAESTIHKDSLTGLVLAEEYGHHLDALLNPGEDTAGDEGDLFAKILFAEDFSHQDLALLRKENDSGIVNVNGELIDVEQSQIAVESVGNRIFQSRTEKGNIYTRSSDDGENWTAWHESGGRTYDAPALASVGNRLYQSVRGTDNRIYTRSSYNGENWTSWHQAGGLTYDAPALASVGNKLYQSVRGTDNRIYTRSSYNGENWTGWHQAGGLTYDAPALEAVGDKLYQSVRGTNNRIYTRSSYNGKNWTAWHDAGGLTYDAPALEAVGDKLYQSVRGTNNRIYTRSSLNGRNWSDWHQTNGISYDAPSLASFNNKLYQTHRGTTNRVYNRTSYDGRNWSSWHETDSVYRSYIGSSLLRKNYATFERVQGPGFFEDKETWFVIHGLNSDASKFEDLSKAIEEYDGVKEGGQHQVITVDWSSAAGENPLYLPSAATWIDNVAVAIKNFVDTLGISSDKINLVGHSLGAYVAYETSERLRGIDKLVALSPASTTLGGYDISQVNFSKHSEWSWAFFHNDMTDHADKTRTADESFKIDFPWANPEEGHGGSKILWTNMLRDKYGDISRYFGLEDISRYSRPWSIDHYSNGLAGPSWEAKIVAKDTLGWQGTNWVPDKFDAI